MRASFTPSTPGKLGRWKITILRGWYWKNVQGKAHQYTIDDLEPRWRSYSHIHLLALSKMQRSKISPFHNHTIFLYVCFDTVQVPLYIWKLSGNPKHVARTQLYDKWLHVMQHLRSIYVYWKRLCRDLYWSLNKLYRGGRKVNTASTRRYCCKIINI